MNIFVFLSVLLSFATAQVPPPANVNPLEARGFFKSEQLRPGYLEDLVIDISIQEGFTAYHDRFRLKSVTPKDLNVGELSVSPIIDFYDKTAKKKKKGVRGNAKIATQVEIPQNMTNEWSQLDFQLTYIACTEKYCLTPRTVTFAIDVSGQLPAPKESTTSSDATSSIQEQITNNLPYALLLIFFFGLVTSLTPCVYPLIPITLTVLGAQKSQTRPQAFLLSLCYVLGIGITYASLGVLAAQTGQLFGSMISHPAVVVAMSLVFIAMGLSLLGFFELQPPAFIRNRMANASTGSGLGGSFVAGLLAGVVASPCVGPVLVGILSYIAKTQDSFLGFVLLFTFAMGFGVLFILLGTFSQLAQKLPKSGPWMNTVKTVLALAMFGLSFWYAWPVLKNQLPQAKISKTNGIEWQKFSPDKVKKAAKDKRPVIIDFYADWCAACVEMDQLTFVVPQIIERSKSFVMLKVDATAPFDELTEWQTTYEVYGLPTMIFIDSNGEVRKDLTLTGFEEPKLFKERMDKVSQTATK